MVLVTAYHLTVQSRTGRLFGLLLPGAAPACMAQGVVYADLKFATAPPVTTPTCPTAPDEDDSPYENLPLGPVPTVPSPGRWPRRWRIPRRLLAASLLVLLVLLVVAAVSLGACYWQVTQSLQAASREHAAEQGRLSQEVSAREQSLEQTRVELAWARAELQRAWQEGNSSQKELGSRDAELGRARQELTVLQQETQELRGALRDSNSTVNILRACVNTDCCPSGWVLYRSKCLFISMQKTTWFESSEDCRKKSAHLLVQGSWPSWTVPDFTQQYGARYWVGDTYWNTYNETVGSSVDVCFLGR
ncbi:B-cell differentiation antigen CD72-like isoform X2 [Cuculus canorus]|uniref:B-cell differentiation antigen CD72-like isoform X2 n=1 Tax=Cuculus canorus TaxID=55661 RepID=UPI0023AA366C|nr:B-cell differentiation antigen CD72-like isoform X2 [Cuculus canorus]